MPVPSTIDDLSTSAASNSPLGSENPGVIDDYLRSIQSIIKHESNYLRAQMGGQKNKVINGNFSINQRSVSGTVTLAAGAYGHDRWKAGSSGCTYNFSTTENVTTLTITAGTLVQVIEGLNLQSGTHILTWIGTAQGRIDSGAYGASGITGTAVGGTNQSIEFSTGTVSKVQYEEGTIATPFEHRPIGLELELCQRYGESVGVLIFHGYGASGNIFNARKPFKVTKRVAPTLTGQTTTANVNCTVGTIFADSVDCVLLVEILNVGPFVATVTNTFASAEL